MKADDYRADNLLSRVFAYTPRQDRQPLEDFCTEVLAWCLRNSREFSNAFLKAAVPKLADFSGPLSVHTQLSFKEAGDEADDEDAGRFDLVIQSQDSYDFVLIVECKINAEFRPTQLQKYRDQLDSGPRFSLVSKRRRYLVALTDHGELQKLDNAEGRLRWSAIHKLLLQAAGGAPGRNEKNPAAVHYTCQQFADFLQDKGMNLTLAKADDPLIANCAKGMRFRENIERLLQRVREGNPELKKLLKNRAQYDGDDEGTWLGLYHKGTHPYFYIGIQFTDHDKPCYEMVVQGAWPPSSSEKDKVEEVAKLKGIFPGCLGLDPLCPHLEVRRRIRPDYDGEPEKMVGWLVKAGVRVGGVRHK